MKRFLKSMAAVAVALLVSGVAAAHPPSGGHRGSTTNINTLSNVANGSGNRVSIANQGSSVQGGFHRGESTTNINTLSNVANGNGNRVSISNQGSSVFGGFSRGGSTTNTNSLSGVANGNGNSVTISNH